MSKPTDTPRQGLRELVARLKAHIEGETPPAAERVRYYALSEGCARRLITGVETLMDAVEAREKADKACAYSTDPDATVYTYDEIQQMHREDEAARAAALALIRGDDNAGK